MKIHTDYDKFHAQLDQIAPIYLTTQHCFDDPKDWERYLFSVAALTSGQRFG
ncbi:MAG TPA: hypothetical protein VN946_10595 [Terriglobales bacterium]|jgi:O-acetylhomoserine/O-acetylserine sulfhydrylase-like pyridoxal-dependent enzyme|nr:hypothetical protein [Terriglobales bacterium]